MEMMRFGLLLLVMVRRVLSELLIPRQIIMTGKPESLSEMPEEVQANVKHTIGLSKDMKFRWFGDQACHDYIRHHFDHEILYLFDQANPGFYRGDICRAAVLFQEGGFYADVDVQLAVPIESIVDDNTTFASAFSRNGEIFNGIIAVVPQSAILSETLKEIKNWYYGDTGHVYRTDSYMGTQTMFRGMQRAVNVACDVADLNQARPAGSWECGQHIIRMYEEKPLNCYPEGSENEKQKWLEECPVERQGTPKYAAGMRLGLFPVGQKTFPGRKLIGWPRYSACKDEHHGCGSGGHDYVDQDDVSQSAGLASLVQSASSAVAAIGRRVVQMGSSLIHWPGGPPATHGQVLSRQAAKSAGIMRRPMRRSGQLALQVDDDASFLASTQQN